MIKSGWWEDTGIPGMQKLMYLGMVQIVNFSKKKKKYKKLEHKYEQILLTNWSFDGQKWTEEPDMRHPRCGAAAVSFEANQMLIIGGPRRLPTERRTYGYEFRFFSFIWHLL